MAFERLSKELEITLELIRDSESDPSKGLPQVRGVNIGECSKELAKLGYIKSFRLDPNGSSEACAHHLTLKGRNYWGERRRNYTDRYMPLIVGSLVGGTLGLVGVWLGWHLSHL